MNPLQGKLVRLRAFEPEDDEAVFAWLNDPGMPVPGFALDGTDGSRMVVNELRGTPVLLPLARAVSATTSDRSACRVPKTWKLTSTTPIAESTSVWFCPHFTLRGSSSAAPNRGRAAT